MKLFRNLKKWYWIPMISVAVIIATLFALWFPYRLQIVSDGGLVSISLERNVVQAFTPPILGAHSGFEANSLTLEGFGVTGSPIIASSPSPVHTGTYSLNCTTSASVANVANIGGKQITFWMKINSLPSVDTALIWNTITNNNTVILTTTGKLKIYNGSATGSTSLDTTNWHRISAAWNGNTGVTGAEKVWIDGELELNTTNLAVANPLLAVGIGTTCNASIFIDDIAGGQDATLKDLGDIRTKLSLPDKPGDFANFDTPVGSATHWQNVDDPPSAVSDADYNEQAGSSQVLDLYGTQNCTALSISNVVAINIFARMSTSNTASTAGISAKNDGYTDNTTLSTTTTITWYSKYYGSQILTGTLAWTDSAFNKLQVGARSTGTTRDTFLYAEWVMVAYAVAPSPITNFISPSQTTDSIYLTWTKGANSDNTLIRHRSDGTYPTSITDGTLSYNGTASSVNVTGLSSGTTYKFRAWGYSSTLDLYSSNVDLTQATQAGGAHAITNAPSSKAMGVLQPNTLYYAKGTAPNNPVLDSDCSFTLVNTGSDNVDIDIHCGNFTGGVGWTLVSGVPSTDEVRMIVYKLGDNPTTDNKTLTGSDQKFVSNLGTGSHTHWDFSMQIGTPTDGAEKTGIIRLTAKAVS